MIPLLLAFSAVSAADSSALAGPCSAARWYASLAPPDSRGVRIRVEGTVFRPDGKTPAAGAILYAYHTGIDGLYSEDAQGRPKFRAWLKTDAAGRYRYETIRPAPYPTRDMAAHVHIQFWGEGIPLQYAEDLYFDDDPLVTPKMRKQSAKAGRFANVIRAVVGDDGVPTFRQDFRLKAAADRMENNILHGVQACK